MKQTTELMNAKLSEQDLEKVHDIIIAALGVAREQITPEARIMEDLGADSLDVVEITMQLEQTFNVTIPDEDVEKAPTVEEMCNVVAKLIGSSV